MESGQDSKKGKASKTSNKPQASKKATLKDPLDIEDQNALKENAISEAISKMGGGRLSAKQKEEVKQRSMEMLAPTDPTIACIGHLKQIVSIASRYADKITKNPTPIREYFKLLLALLRKPLAEKLRLASGHIDILTALYKAYKSKLIDEDLTWLDAGTATAPTGNDIVVLSYGKNGRAQIPLSELYRYLNDTNDENLLKDGLELDHHLWSIFSKITKDQGEKKRFEELADECKTATAPESAVGGISAKIRDKVLQNEKAVNLKTDTHNSNEIVKTVFQELENSDEMKELLKGFTESAKEGTFDLARVVATVTEGVQQPTDQEVDEADK